MAFLDLELILDARRMISGFLLESELNEVDQDVIERFIVNQNLTRCPGWRSPRRPSSTTAYTTSVSARAERTSAGEATTRSAGPSPSPPWHSRTSAARIQQLRSGKKSSIRRARSPASAAGYMPDAQDQQINPGLEGEPANPLAPVPGPLVEQHQRTHPDMTRVSGRGQHPHPQPIMEGFDRHDRPVQPAS